MWFSLQHFLQQKPVCKFYVLACDFLDLTSCDLHLNEKYVLIPCTFKECDIGNYTVSISYPKDVPASISISEIDPLFEMAEASGEWTKETAGGCYNLPNEWKKVL